MSHHHRRGHRGDDSHSEHNRDHHHGHSHGHHHHRWLDDVRHPQKTHSRDIDDRDQKDKAEQKSNGDAESKHILNFKNHDIYAAPAGKTSADLNGPANGLIDNNDAQLRALGQKLANFADEVATLLGTVGDCAHGPRLAFARAGLNFSPAIATKQGYAVRNSGMFDEVSRDQVRPGDYGVRDWSPSVVRSHHGINKGDSFIVTRIDGSGRLYGANDHHLKVPEDGGRYRNLKFYRLNENFLRLYYAGDC